MKQKFQLWVLNILECLPQIAIIVIMAVVLLVIMSSCTTTRTIEKPVVVTEVHHDTLRLTKVVNSSDTVRIHDSIVVTQEGVDRWHTTTMVRVKERIDTVYMHVVDSVPKVVTVTKTITKTRTKDIISTWIMIFIVLSLISYAVYRVQNAKR